MAWFHVRLERNDGRSFSQLDRSEDDVKKIVSHYNRREKFYFDQRVIDPKDIEVISIFRSIDTSRRIMSDYNTQDPGKVFEKSYDVTANYNITPAANVNEIQELPKVKVKDLKNISKDTPIFIVHGHDDASKNELANFLSVTLHLKPVILRDLPSQGKTVIEKFENYSSDIGYCFVLLTPDDVGGTDQTQLSPRARQNVILELGYFIAKLGRDRVTCLCKGRVEIPSDVLGVLNIQYENHVSEKQWDIYRELSSAGYNVA